MAQIKPHLKSSLIKEELKRSKWCIEGHHDGSITGKWKVDYSKLNEQARRAESYTRYNHNHPESVYKKGYESKCTEIDYIHFGAPVNLLRPTDWLLLGKDFGYITRIKPYFELRLNTKGICPQIKQFPEHKKYFSDNPEFINCRPCLIKLDELQIADQVEIKKVDGKLKIVYKK